MQLVEFRLLLYPCLLAILGQFLFMASPMEPSEPNPWGLLILIAIIMGTHFFRRSFKLIADPYIFPLSAYLNILGLLLIYRLEPQLAVKQFYWTVLGLGMFLSTSMLVANYRQLGEYKYIYAVLGIFFLAITAVMGTELGGARAWLTLGSFRFQPAELVKILIVLFLASYLDETKEVLSLSPRYFLTPHYWGPLAIMMGLVMVLLAFQNDLGTAAIFFGTFLVMLYVSTQRISYVITGTAVFLALAALGYGFFPHIRTRVAVWINPWPTIDTTGYQITQALFALGSGGLFGSGLGNGLPDRIPAVATDFIFAAVGEELGLAGSLAIIFLYTALSLRGYRAALNADTSFGLLLATGLTTILALQATVIIGGVLKLLPLTGITLPFVSYGGSSLLVNYIILGLLNAVNRGSSYGPA